MEIDVSDHAVLRWLERFHGLDVGAIKAMLAGRAMSAAELGASAVVVEGVRLALQRDRLNPAGVVVTTVTKPRRPMPRPERQGGAREADDE